MVGISDVIGSTKVVVGMSVVVVEFADVEVGTSVVI